MHSVIERVRKAARYVRAKAIVSWNWYRARVLWQQIAIGLAVLLILIGLISLLKGDSAEEASAQVRTVTLASVGTLSGNETGASIVGSVRSVTEAELHAESGGTVRSVRTSLGAYVPAGFVIAELDNSSESASVLQAEGAYDAAVAARNAQSLPDTRNSARDTYQSAYASLDTTLENDIDTFFGDQTPTGPRLLINPGHSQDLGRKRQALDTRMNAWRDRLATSGTTDPNTLLTQAITDTQAVSSFLVELAGAANESTSDATPEQLASLGTARAGVDATLSRLNTARTGLRSGTVSATASADASVKSALGSLRAAQAAYEKTRIRASIGGTVNYLPVKPGQYVNMLDHVATVANNGALEIVAYVPESSRNTVSVGMKVKVEGTYAGTITAVAPALDPITKQIEVRVAVDPTPELVNGQSVRITLPSTESAPVPAVATTATTSASTAKVLLPLTAVKLLPESRAVFTVDTEGRVVAHTVTIGDVVGDRIEVLTGVSSDMRIITDVRGLSAGQKVRIGEETN
jgi:multidrug efflux pump subunit AcrA (membrane-fusion protein)